MAEIQTVQRQVGLMDHKLTVSWWALAGSLNAFDGGYKCGPATMNAVMHGKRSVVEEAVAITDIAMETVGGASYFRTRRSSASTATLAQGSSTRSRPRTRCCTPGGWRSTSRSTPNSYPSSSSNVFE